MPEVKPKPESCRICGGTGVVFCSPSSATVFGMDVLCRHPCLHCKPKSRLVDGLSVAMVALLAVPVTPTVDVADYRRAVIRRLDAEIADANRCQ